MVGEEEVEVMVGVAATVEVVAMVEVVAGAEEVAETAILQTGTQIQMQKSFVNYSLVVSLQNQLRTLSKIILESMEKLWTVLS